MKQVRVWKYGDDINTDVLFPGKYTYSVTDPDEIRSHALEDLDPDFVDGVRPGDLIVGGRNWGCGSSREQAVSALALCGVAAIVAQNFARIYFRNAINQGLPAYAAPGIVDQLEHGELVRFDYHEGTIVKASAEAEDRVLQLPELSPSLRAIVDAGGLIALTRRRLRRNDDSVGAIEERS